MSSVTAMINRAVATIRFVCCADHDTRFALHLPRSRYRKRIVQWAPIGNDPHYLVNIKPLR